MRNLGAEFARLTPGKSKKIEEVMPRPSPPAAPLTASFTHGGVVPHNRGASQERKFKCAGPVS